MRTLKNKLPVLLPLAPRGPSTAKKIVQNL